MLVERDNDDDDDDDGSSVSGEGDSKDDPASLSEFVEQAKVSPKNLIPALYLLFSFNRIADLPNAFTALFFALLRLVAMFGIGPSRERVLAPVCSRNIHLGHARQQPYSCYYPMPNPNQYRGVFTHRKLFWRVCWCFTFDLAFDVCMPICCVRLCMHVPILCLAACACFYSSFCLVCVFVCAPPLCCFSVYFFSVPPPPPLCCGCMSWYAPFLGDDVGANVSQDSGLGLVRRRSKEQEKQ